MSEELLRIRHCCPSCKSTSTNLLINHPYNAPLLKNYFNEHYQGLANTAFLENEMFEVVECNHCGLIFQPLVPSDSLLVDIYDQWIPIEERGRLQQGYELHDYAYLAEQIVFLIQYFRKKPSQITVFDFGLGWSEWASMASSYGCEVFGSELSIERVEYAKSKGINIVSWDDIPKHKFHFINTEQVFEHLVNPLETLQHLATGLKEGGLIKIGVPDGRRVRKYLRHVKIPPALPPEYMMPIAPLEHINCFDYASLVELGLHAGLVPIHPNFRFLCNAATGWLQPKQALKNILRPIYRYIYPRSTTVYFTKLDNKSAQ